MLKKRLIGVVTVKGGWAVQSFGYQRYLPLGSVECVVENLDRWGADEIVVQVIDRSRDGLGPDLQLIRRLAARGLRTPLAYGGGVRSAEDGVAAVLAGADRIVIDSVLHEAPEAAVALADKLGAQALIAAMPVAMGDEGLRWWNHVRGSERPMPARMLDVVATRCVAELLVIDWRHEGTPAAYDARLLDALPPALASVARIPFGGISSAQQISALLEREDVSAVAIGNFLNYTEHAVQDFRVKAGVQSLRPATYAGEGEA